MNTSCKLFNDRPLKSIHHPILRNLIFFSLFLYLIFLLGSCSGKDSESDKKSVNPRLEQSIALTEGETINFERGDVKVKFLKIVDDSRCRPEMTCIFEGKVTAVFDYIQGDKQPISIKLTKRAGQPNLAEKNINGFLIHLDQVSTPRQLGQKIESNRYEVNITLKKY